MTTTKILELKQDIFKENEVTLTMPLVGTNFYHWDSTPRILEKLTEYVNSFNQFAGNYMKDVNEMKQMITSLKENDIKGIKQDVEKNQEDIQELTDKYIEKTDAVAKAKEKEVMTI